MTQNNIGRDTQNGDRIAAFDTAQQWDDPSRVGIVRPLIDVVDYTAGDKHKNAGLLLL